MIRLSSASAADAPALSLQISDAPHASKASLTSLTSSPFCTTPTPCTPHVGNPNQSPAHRLVCPRQYANIMTREIQPKAKSLGLPHITWRLFRHWHATVLGDAGVPVKATQERLGHYRSEITMKFYTHLTSAATDQAAQTDSAALGNQALN